MSLVLSHRKAVKVPASLSGPVPEGFNPSIEYLRFVAALLVVAFHAIHIGPLGGQFPVAFFTIVLVFMTLRGRAARPARLALRMRRLLRLWAVWTVIYLLQLLEGVLERRPPWQVLRDWLPPAGILWFLPFAALVTLALPAAAVATGLGLLATAGDLPMRCSCPVRRSLHRSRGAVLAAAVGAGFLGLGLAGAGLSFATPFMLAARVAALALCWPLSELPGARRLGALSMDVYLNHTLALALVNTLLPLSTKEPAGLAVRLPPGRYLR